MRRGAFTLIELCTAVAVVAVLSALAVPEFREFQARARLAEVRANFDGLRYEVVPLWSNEPPTEDLITGWNPDAHPGKELRPWDTSQPNWDAIEWNPDGAVRCSYFINYIDESHKHRISALCDLDGDGNELLTFSEYYYDDENGTFTGNCTGTFETVTVPDATRWTETNVPCF